MNREQDPQDGQAPDPRPDETPGEVPGLGELDLSAEPARDLWAGIEARIAPPRRRGAWTAWVGYAAAASVTVAIGLSLWRTPPQELLPAAPGAAAGQAAAAPGTALMAYAPQEHAALVKAHLQIVNSAESELRQALEQDPHNPSLLRLQQSMNNQRQGLRKLLAQRT